MTGLHCGPVAEAMKRDGRQPAPEVAPDTVEPAVAEELCSSPGQVGDSQMQDLLRNCLLLSELAPRTVAALQAAKDPLDPVLQVRSPVPEVKLRSRHHVRREPFEDVASENQRGL